VLIDTHCHLDFNAFDEDRDLVLQRAREAGVERIINPGIDLRSSAHILEMASRYQEVYPAVGVHPNDARTWSRDSKQELRQLASQDKVVAIGEIGLDYYRDYAPPDLQHQVLAEQLEVALELKLPVILHCRNQDPQHPQAFSDLVGVLEPWLERVKECAPELYFRPGVFHSFSGSGEDARRVIGDHFFIGITGPVTYKNASVLKGVVRDVPLDRLLLETDAPFLTPEPRRGQRNEPSYLGHVVHEIADQRGTTAEEVARATQMNAQRLFWQVTN
jgi:TatD DNase family protein